MSPKDVLEPFETTYFDARQSPDSLKHEWDLLYPDDPERHFMPVLSGCSPYPEGSTLEERIQMRKDNLPKIKMIDTQWGIRPA